MGNDSLTMRSLYEMNENEANFVTNSDVQSFNNVRIFIQTSKTVKWLYNKEIAVLKVSNPYPASVENMVSY